MFYADFIADMKKKLSQLLTVCATALALSTVPSCIPPELLEGDWAALAETLGGSVSSSGESYDEYGNPIYGYDGNQPVYGYDALGDPIYLLSALTSESTVPQWEPLPGAAPRPYGVRRGGPPPHARNRHGHRLKRPGDRTRRMGGHPRSRHDRHHNRHHDRHDRNRMDRGHDRPDRNHMDRGHGRPDRMDRGHGRPNHMDRGHGRPNHMDRGHGRPDRMDRGKGKPERAERKRPDGPAGKPGRGGDGDRKQGRGRH